MKNCAGATLAPPITFPPKYSKVLLTYISVAAFEFRVSKSVSVLAVVLPVDMTLNFPRGFMKDDR